MAAGVRPHACFDTVPQKPHRPKFGERRELVGVGGQAKFQRRGVFERAKIGEARSEGEGEFLRRRAARIVNAARVCGGEGSGEAASTEIGDGRAQRRAVWPGRAGAGETAKRVETEGDVGLRRLSAQAFDQRRDSFGLREIADVEGEPDAGIERYAFESLMQDRGV